MRTATSAHVATTASASLAAFSELRMQNVVMLSPYVEATHRHEVDFLTQAGLSVVGGPKAAGPP